MTRWCERVGQFGDKWVNCAPCFTPSAFPSHVHSAVIRKHEAENEGWWARNGRPAGSGLACVRLSNGSRVFFISGHLVFCRQIIWNQPRGLAEFDAPRHIWVCSGFCSNFLDMKEKWRRLNYSFCFLGELYYISFRQTSTGIKCVRQDMYLCGWGKNWSLL